jgi:hypothetical protein
MSFAFDHLTAMQGVRRFLNRVLQEAKMRSLMTIVLLTAAIPPAALCDEGDFQAQGQLASGQLLEIRGVLGAIRAQGTTADTYSVSAHKTATNSDPASVSIRVVPFDGGVVICAMYPDADPDKPNTCNPPGSGNTMNVRDNDVEVEFTVNVPSGVRFTASTVRGDIRAASLTPDVNATSIAGEITISTSGGAEASTSVGAITASIGRLAWMGVHHFDTIIGNIDLELPADANVSLRASTIRGTVKSDFPLMINTAPWGQASAAGTLGTDGRSPRLSTDVGNIMLRRGPATMQ